MYKLPSFFCPKWKTKLIRLGQPNDGGYCIPEKSLDETNILFSFGLDDNWSFEEHFKKKSARFRHLIAEISARKVPPQWFFGQSDLQFL